MEIMKKSDDGKQKRRQSKDFNEIQNNQTDMNVEQEEWDRIFHNYENPMACPGRKRVTGCVLCKKFDSGETIIRSSDKKEFKLNE